MSEYINPLPEDAAERKNYPIYTGFIRFFPFAIAHIANHSHKATQQHHPDSPCHWDKSKSADEEDACARHFIEQAHAENIGDNDTLLKEATAKAWRAMANLERILTERKK